MKILILMGRGVEGTGQTRTAIEIHEYLENNGHEVTNIANSEKKWGRNKSQKHKMVDYDMSKNPYLTSEDFDHVIIASTPAKNYSKKSKNNFMDLIEQYKDVATISYVQVDHKIQSINRNFYSENEYKQRFFQALDFVITHDLSNDFCKKILDGLEFNVSYEIKEMMFISCDFDSLVQYRKEQKVDKLCYFIGRKAAWKGIFVLRDLQYNTLSKNGYTTIAEGIEGSIAYLHQLYSSLKPKTPRKDVKLYLQKNPTNIFTTSKQIMMYGPYKREEALDRMSNAKFGMFFTYIGDNYGGPVENTLMEMIGVGLVPVVRKKLWDSGKFIGAKFTDFKPEDIGFIVIDEDDVDILLMNRLNDSNDLYEDYQHRSLKFAKTYFERSKVIGEFWKSIN